MEATHVLRNWVLAPPLAQPIQAALLLPTREEQPPIQGQLLLAALGLARQQGEELGVPLA